MSDQQSQLPAAQRLTQALRDLSEAELRAHLDAPARELERRRQQLAEEVASHQRRVRDAETRLERFDSETKKEAK